MRLSEQPLLSAEQLQQRVRELAEEILRNGAASPPLLVGVLHGAVPFTRDLAHACGGAETVYVLARSYEGMESTGAVTLDGLDQLNLVGRDVLIVEDILDTGRTLTALHAALAALRPARLRTCVLLDKTARRACPFTPEFTGFSIPDAFVVGYGLDHNGDFRDLPDIRTLTP